VSDTPRTDAVTEHYYSAGGLRSAAVVRATFARELERELAQRTAERDEARREVCERAWGNRPDVACYARMRGWDCFDAKEGKP